MVSDDDDDDHQELLIKPSQEFILQLDVEGNPLHLNRIGFMRPKKRWNFRRSQRKVCNRSFYAVQTTSRQIFGEKKKVLFKFKFPQNCQMA